MIDILFGIIFFTALVVLLALAVTGTRAIMYSSKPVTVTVNGTRELPARVGLKLLGALLDDGVAVPAACGGNGSTLATSNIKVKIPAGADTGSKVKLTGMGGAGAKGGPPGSLYIELSVRPHPAFKREGNNLFVDVPVNISDAVLGGKIKVPTINGSVTMTLPPGTDSGKKFRLKGKGVPDRKRGIKGDEFAVIKIVVPRNANDKTKKALEEIGKAYE